MASYTLTITKRGQTLPFEATATGTEDVYTIAMANQFANAPTNLLIKCTGNPILVASEATTSTTGFAVAVAPDVFRIAVGNGNKFYVRGVLRNRVTS